MAVKLTKNELKVQKDRLKQFQRYLPTLQLKKQQLQSVVMHVTAQLEEVERQRRAAVDGLDDWVAVFAENESFPEGKQLQSLVRPSHVECGQENIAGVTVPVFRDLSFEEIRYDVADYPLWVDTAAVRLREIARLDALAKTLRRQVELLEKELRSTAQRVNLFEKVKIPEAKENIRVIGIYLGDQQTSAVVRGKIAKKKAAGGGPMIEKNEGGPHCDHCGRKKLHCWIVCSSWVSSISPKRPLRISSISSALPICPGWSLCCRSTAMFPRRRSLCPMMNLKSFFSELSACIERKKRCRRSRPPLMPPRKGWPSGAASPPTDLRSLKDAGWDIHIYRTDKKTMAALLNAPDVQIIRLSPVGKMQTFATLSPLPGEYSATEFPIPDKGLEELEQEQQRCAKGLSDCEVALRQAASHLPSIRVQMLKTQNDAEYSAVSNTSQSQDGLVWLRGYLPAAQVEDFKAAAAQAHWAWALEDPDADDDQVPTKVKYNKVTKLMIPVFDILGTVPGYREYDISFWFLGFFTLFFAMIIGDAGYGCLFLLLALVLTLKGKKKSNAVQLLWVLSIATIIWGALTGTWFGLEQAMDVPLLRSLVIPHLCQLSGILRRIHHHPAKHHYEVLFYSGHGAAVLGLRYEHSAQAEGEGSELGGRSGLAGRY